MEPEDYFAFVDNQLRNHGHYLSLRTNGPRAGLLTSNPTRLEDASLGLIQEVRRYFLQDYAVGENRSIFVGVHYRLDIPNDNKDLRARVSLSPPIGVLKCIRTKLRVLDAFLSYDLDTKALAEQELSSRVITNIRSQGKIKDPTHLSGQAMKDVLQEVIEAMMRK